MNKTGSLVRLYVVPLKDNIKQLHNLFKSSLMCLNHVPRFTRISGKYSVENLALRKLWVLHPTMPNYDVFFFKNCEFLGN